MSVTPNKYHPRKNMSEIFPTPTNNDPPLKMVQYNPKKGTKNHYEVSEASDTDILLIG